MGMLGGGITRWRKGQLLPFGPKEGFVPSFAANVLGDSRGDIWLGSWGNGLWRIHGGELRKEQLPVMPATAHIRALAEDQKGNVWIGTWFNGIYRFDGKSFERFLTGNESLGDAVSALCSRSLAKARTPFLSNEPLRASSECRVNGGIASDSLW